MSDRPPYIKRPIDDEFYDCLQQNIYCHIWGQPQIGKSSLLKEISKRAKADKILCVVLSLQDIAKDEPTEFDRHGIVFARIKDKVLSNYDGSVLELCQWFELLIERLMLVTGLLSKSSQDQQIEILIGYQKIIIFLDDIDRIQDLSFSSQRDFITCSFNTIFKFNSTAKSRLLFTSSGAASIDKLILGINCVLPKGNRQIQPVNFRLKQLKASSNLRDWMHRVKVSLKNLEEIYRKINDYLDNTVNRLKAFSTKRNKKISSPLSVGLCSLSVEAQT